MSQNLKQNALGRKMLHRFCRSLIGLGMAVLLWNSSLFIPLAQADIVEYKPAYNEEYGAFDDPDEKQAIENALAYISSLMSDGTGAYHKINISVDKRNDDMSSGALAHAKNNHISVNPSYTFSYEEPSQVYSGDNNLTRVLIHEMGHNLGILDNIPMNDGDSTVTMNYWKEPFVKYAYNDYVHHMYYRNSDGNNIRMIDQIDPIAYDDHHHTSATFEYNTSTGSLNGIFTFHGDKVDEVFNDGGPIVQYLQLENGQSGFYTIQSSSSLCHPYTEHGVMNAIDNSTDRPFFSEVELAMLVELGNNIDLKKHFGQSYYLSHGAITNTNGFNSDSLYGIGLHVVAGGNQVTQAANINANGKYASGITSEGKNNSITINSGVTVSATGEGGIGVLFMYEKANSLTNMGTIHVDKGTGVYADEDINTINNFGTIQADNGCGISVRDHVDTINNTGTIFAKTKAVHLTFSGKVTNFNIMGNSQITGDIYDGANGIEYLSFGLLANADGVPIANKTGDQNFNGTINGNISSFDSAMELHGGNLNITGEVNVRYLSISAHSNAANSKFNAPGSVTVGTDIDLGNSGQTVIYDGNSTGSLKTYNGNISNYQNSTIQNVATIHSSGYLYNNGTLQNNNLIQNNRFFNNGDMINISTVYSDHFENNGNINNVSTVNVSNTLTNHSSGNMSNVTNVTSDDFTNLGSMTNVSTVNSNYFLNSGELTVGEAGSTETMNVKGIMENSNGTLNIDANLQAKTPVPGTTDDLIIVKKNGSAGTNDGIMDIDGGELNVNELHSTGDDYYRADIKHYIIRTESGVVVNSDMEVNELGYDIPLFKPVVGYDDKNVWLSLQRDFLYGPAAQTENQKALGYYLDEIGKTPNPAGDLFPVLLQLDSLNGDKKAGIVSARALQALDEMSGAVYGTVPSLANQHATMVNNSLAKHLRCWSPCDVMVNNWNLWGEGYGIGGNAKHDGNANGYNYSVGGMLIGIDRQISIDGHFGFYFAVGSTNANVKELSESAESTDIFAGAYFNYKDSIGWYTTIFAGLGFSDYDVERHFSFIPRNNKSNFDSRQVNVYLERGKNFSISDIWVFQPFGGLQFISSDRDAIQENGADLLDLTVAGTNMKSLRSLFGIKLATVNCVTGRKLNSEITAAWMHEYLDTTSVVSAQMSNPGGAYFESSPTFIVRGHNDGRDWFVAGAGLNYAFTDYFKIFGGYDCMINGVGAMHRGNLGLEIRR